jgi:hypothetical protein
MPDLHVSTKASQPCPSTDAEPGSFLALMSIAGENSAKDSAPSGWGDAPVATLAPPDQPSTSSSLQPTPRELTLSDKLPLASEAPIASAATGAAVSAPVARVSPAAVGPEAAPVGSPASSKAVRMSDLRVQGTPTSSSGAEPPLATTKETSHNPSRRPCSVEAGGGGSPGDASMATSETVHIAKRPSSHTKLGAAALPTSDEAPSGAAPTSAPSRLPCESNTSPASKLAAASGQRPTMVATGDEVPAPLSPSHSSAEVTARADRGSSAASDARVDGDKAVIARLTQRLQDQADESQTLASLLEAANAAQVAANAQRAASSHAATERGVAAAAKTHAEELAKVQAKGREAVTAATAAAAKVHAEELAEMRGRVREAQERASLKADQLLSCEARLAKVEEEAEGARVALGALRREVAGLQVRVLLLALFVSRFVQLRCALVASGVYERKCSAQIHPCASLPTSFVAFFVGYLVVWSLLCHVQRHSRCLCTCDVLGGP